ncbi:MAG: trypsin-like peptidase domain-containing protein [Acidobacteria bacterium]|nr:trypsin-like peptidase domain-containing protein [Acidobacteriota bacterium]
MQLSRSYNLPVIGDRSGFQEFELEFEAGIVGTEDNRTRVLDTRQSPHRFICHLLVEWLGADGKTTTTTGTGTLISNSQVLTCGHVLVHRDSGGRPVRAARIAVSPGRDSSRNATYSDRLKWTPFGSYVTEQFAAAPQWSRSFDPQYDFALITLKSEVGKKKFHGVNGKPLGYWGSPAYGAGTVFAPADPAALKGKTVFVCGYPGDKCGAAHYDLVSCPKGQWAGTQFRAQDVVVDPMPAAEPRLFYHNADAEEGESGAPIWRVEGQRYYLAGIETAAAFTFGRTALYNVGVRITAELLASLKTLGWRV